MTVINVLCKLVTYPVRKIVVRRRLTVTII